MKEIKLDKIMTEGINENTTGIDIASTEERLKMINKEDSVITKAIEKAIPEITKVIDETFDSFTKGGRLFYIGAGSSGRVGVLDASEMLPTYGVSDQIIGIIAGGDLALRNPIEGAEDDDKQVEKDLNEHSFSSKDVLLAIGASGRTPYCSGGLKYAKSIGAKAFALCMTPNSEFSKIADLTIAVETGPEVITGSTRMKSGTATKMVVNMISTSLMVMQGKVFKNMMVDVKATNEKLVVRAFNIVKQVSECIDDEKILSVLKETGYDCKLSIVMIVKSVNQSEAKKMLEEAQGVLRKVI